MDDPRIVDVDSSPSNTRKSPVTAILESIEGDYLTTRDIAEKFGVHIETIRRLSKSTKSDGTPRVKAPSKKIEIGGLLIYLYTTDDVAELEKYFGSRVSTHKKE